ncbi:ABC transporter substrate-binding protein [Massilia violaceinigra]|uniref:ABC transporter substrate-binding protein n=1 Tax=Massilia violaceinigra TaxID=2045208 RepID=A0A2D2DKT8_9BURK|nr:MULTISPECIES: energy transducer TonB [Massilia]ATQ75581.1 ABC transporter substrate-binding protein [Massilia violaceinigra]MDQ1922578.1 energy transducer TonB [Massilia sp. CCM 9206]
MNFSHDKNPGKNFTGIAVVIAIHALVAWGIVSGLGTRMVTKMAEAVETKIVEEVKPPPPPDVPPPPPPPEMKAPPPPFIPPVEVNVQQPPPVQNTIATATNVKPTTTELPRPTTPAPPAPPAPANPNPVRVAAVADFNTCAKPEFPKASLRNEETGTVTLSFLIGVDGRVADSKIVKSSGFRDLDKAAQAGISKCKFKPTMVDGKPEQAWMQMQYVWTLD